jgi:hypothetical protein
MSPDELRARAEAILAACDQHPETDEDFWASMIVTTTEAEQRLGIYPWTIATWRQRGLINLIDVEPAHGKGRAKNLWSLPELAACVLRSLRKGAYFGRHRFAQPKPDP